MTSTPNHAEREHAPFSPSASDRWLTCPASVRLTETLAAQGALPPRSDNQYTVAGTLCHETAEEFLRNWKNPADDPVGRSKDYTDEKGNTRRVMLDADEWQKHVVQYVSAVRECYEDMRLQYGDDVLLLVEEKVGICGADCFGTIDAAVVVPHKEIHVFDLKAGSGHIVSADAPQFLTYLVGLAAKYSDKITVGGMVFTAHVCQAADEAEPHKKCGYLGGDIADHLKAIKAAVKASKTADPGPVGDHCRWCPVAGLCPAQRTNALAVLDDDAAVPTVDVLTMEQRVEIVRVAKDIRSFLDAVERSLLDDALRGVEVPGYKVVNGRSQRKWNPELSEEEIAEELELYGLDPWEQKLTSFTKVEKALKNVGADVVNRLVVKPDGKPTLVPDADKRKPVADSLEVLNDAE